MDGTAMKLSQRKKDKRIAAFRETWGDRPAGWYGQCSNCGEEGPHFVPPSLGDPGFYSCSLD